MEDGLRTQRLADVSTDAKNWRTPEFPFFVGQRTHTYMSAGQCMVHAINFYCVLFLYRFSFNLISFSLTNIKV